MAMIVQCQLGVAGLGAHSAESLHNVEISKVSKYLVIWAVESANKEFSFGSLDEFCSKTKISKPDIYHRFNRCNTHT